MRWWPPLLHLGLIGVALALALLRFSGLDDVAPPPAAMNAETSAQPAQGAAGATEAGGAGTVVDLAPLTARPLFIAGRRPLDAPVPTESPSPDAGPSAPEFRMLGYLNDGSRPRAILSSDPSSPDMIVREGDEFQGFTVFRISRDAIVLRHEGKEITINMFRQ